MDDRSIPPGALCKHQTVSQGEQHREQQFRGLLGEVVSCVNSGDGSVGPYCSHLDNMLLLYVSQIPLPCFWEGLSLCTSFLSMPQACRENYIQVKRCPGWRTSQ